VGRVAVAERAPEGLSDDRRAALLLRVEGLALNASELCVSGRGRAAPWWAVGHFVEGLFCPPAGGASALLDRRYPLEYLSPCNAHVGDFATEV